MGFAAQWGVIAGLWMYYIHQQMDGDRLGFMDSTSTQTGLLLYVGLKGLMIVFYLTVRFTPIEYLYRRPALNDYVAFLAVGEACHVVAAILLHLEYDIGYCIEGAAMFIITGIMEPAVIFYTLSQDSQYWQGKFNKGSAGAMTAPFQDILEDISSETVNALATCVQDLEKQPIPILHFGLIEMEQNLGYAAGGFSRVYFGKMNGQRVALKLLFTVELTPRVGRMFIIVEKRNAHASLTSTNPIDYCRVLRGSDRPTQPCAPEHRGVLRRLHPPTRAVLGAGVLPPRLVVQRAARVQSHVRPGAQLAATVALAAAVSVGRAAQFVVRQRLASQLSFDRPIGDGQRPVPASVSRRTGTTANQLLQRRSHPVRRKQH
jgi:hypothetical protein